MTPTCPVEPDHRSCEREQALSGGEGGRTRSWAVAGAGEVRSRSRRTRKVEDSGGGIVPMIDLVDGRFEGKAKDVLGELSWLGVGRSGGPGRRVQAGTSAGTGRSSRRTF